MSYRLWDKDRKYLNFRKQGQKHSTASEVKEIADDLTRV